MTQIFISSGRTSARELIKDVQIVLENALGPDGIPQGVQKATLLKKILCTPSFLFFTVFRKIRNR